jgi:hypothetical protein
VFDVKKERGQAWETLFMRLRNRVTRWVCEKIAQNVAQPIFLSKLMHKLIHLNKVAQNVEQVCL